MTMKTLKYTLLAALSIFAAASCTKESTGDIQQPSAGVDVKAVFEAVAEDDMSKALLQSNGGLQWENGDEIAVYQYGYYDYDVTNSKGIARNNSENVFVTTDGSGRFEGTITGYMPLVKENIPSGKSNSYYERYYVAYPADRCGCSSSTGKYNITLPASQTGRIEDFGDYIVYFGYQRSYGENLVEYNASDATLEFLNPFTVFCATPVLKFNVPSNLNVSSIVLSAKDVDGNDVNLAGRLEGIRCDSNPSDLKVTSGKGALEIVIENSGEVISGDVYVVLAPDSGSAGDTHSQFMSTAKTLVLDLFKASGASASLSLSLTGDILAGTIKNLPAIPETITWDYPAGPGLSAIEINKTSITSTSGSTLGARTRILLTPENTESTITYRSRTSLSSLVESTIMNPYNSTNGILRSDADTPENYLEINVATEDYKDFTAYACVWILNKNYGFGKVLYDDSLKYTTIETETETTKVYELAPEIDSTYPTDGSYLYGLSFTYLTAPLNTSSLNTPRLSSDGLYLYNGSTSTTPSKYWSGTLSIKVPQSGKAKLFFDCNRSKGNSRTITIESGTETKATLETGDSSSAASYAVLSTDSFDVTADDVLVISTSKDVRFDSITLLWEPEETEASLATESYASKTSYGN